MKQKLREHEKDFSAAEREQRAFSVHIMSVIFLEIDG